MRKAAGEGGHLLAAVERGDLEAGPQQARRSAAMWSDASSCTLWKPSPTAPASPLAGTASSRRSTGSHPVLSCSPAVRAYQAAQAPTSWPTL